MIILHNYDYIFTNIDRPMHYHSNYFFIIIRTLNNNPNIDTFVKWTRFVTLKTDFLILSFSRDAINAYL